MDMRLFGWLILLCAVAGCSSAPIGESCHSDDECRPNVCNAPVLGPNDPPAEGTCEAPAPVGGVCHRAAECAADLVCVIPAGGSSATGGTCRNQ